MKFLSLTMLALTLSTAASASCNIWVEQADKMALRSMTTTDAKKQEKKIKNYQLKRNLLIWELYAKGYSEVSDLRQADYRASFSMNPGRSVFSTTGNSSEPVGEYTLLSITGESYFSKFKSGHGDSTFKSLLKSIPPCISK